MLVIFYFSKAVFSHFFQFHDFSHLDLLVGFQDVNDHTTDISHFIPSKHQSISHEVEPPYVVNVYVGLPPVNIHRWLL